MHGHGNGTGDRDFEPPSSEFSFIQPLPRPAARGTMNTDLNGYPFSAGGAGTGAGAGAGEAGRSDMQWPVPPGYSETMDHGRGGQRESGIGYSVTGGGGGGGGYGNGNGNGTAWREDAGRTRSPRRIHERGGWM